MFRNFYTTKMSGNAKSLQKRFSKILFLYFVSVHCEIYYFSF